MATIEQPAGVTLVLRHEKGPTPELHINGLDITPYIISYDLDYSHMNGSSLTVHLRVGQINREEK